MIARVRWMFSFAVAVLVGLQLLMPGSAVAVPVISSGTPLAWGYNGDGQLGNVRSSAPFPSVHQVHA